MGKDMMVLFVSIVCALFVSALCTMAMAELNDYEQKGMVEDDIINEKFINNGSYYLRMNDGDVKEVTATEYNSYEVDESRHEYDKNGGPLGLFAAFVFFLSLLFINITLEKML